LLRVFIVISALTLTAWPDAATVIALSCDGTLKSEGRTNPVRNIVLIDLDARTVWGLENVVAPIKEVRATTIVFDFKSNEKTLTGLFDRITGWLHARTSTSEYDLVCLYPKPWF
jgi:hypothetical protein